MRRSRSLSSGVGSGFLRERSTLPVTQLIINSIILGSIYTLLALGFTLVYGILKLINFAHGAIFMVGGYVGYIFATYLGWPAIWTIPFVFVLCGIIGIAHIEQVQAEES